jgi:hypothetical protein
MGKAFIVWQYREKEAVAAFGYRQDAEAFAAALRKQMRSRFPSLDFEVAEGDAREIER